MASAYTYTFTTPGQYTYILPYKAKILDAQVWGGGGLGGASLAGTVYAGGGGGGGFSAATSTLLDAYNCNIWRWTLEINVGASEESSSIKIYAEKWDPKEAITLAEATAGTTVKDNSSSGGAGGYALVGDGYSGGSGADGVTSRYGGGGGGGAGSAAAGSNGSGSSGGTGGTPDGGTGGNGRISTQGNGYPGNTIGGGGGGSIRINSGTWTGGGAGNGQAYIAIDFPFNELLMTFWDTVNRNQTTPTIREIGTGSDSSYIIGDSNFAWGYNLYGQLGDNSITAKSTPVAVCGNHTFCKISHSSGYSMLAIDNNGKAWGWGYNLYGQLGNNITTTSHKTPVAVCGSHTFCEIETGYYHTIAIDNNGKVWAWGSNFNGQLGNNSTTHESTPIAVCNSNKIFNIISAGEFSSFGITIDGALFAWGNNYYGQLGDNSTTNKSTPVAVCGNHKFCKISASTGHVLAIDATNSTWSWGYNCHGQLGDNSTTDKSTPIAVCNSNNIFNIISAGGYTSFGITIDGQPFAWGHNERGQLGDNSITAKSTPVAVCGNHTFCKISTGYEYAIAVDNADSVWAWGYNQYGQLGNNTTTNYKTPIFINI